LNYLSSKIKADFVLTKRFVFSLYILLALITGIKQYAKGSFNNYKIFEYTYIHTLQEKSLYNFYPNEYDDTNHYGPVFSLIIAPFAVLPEAFGTTLWNIANALILCIGFYSLPLSLKHRSLIALICAHEALGAMLSFQFNVALTGLILMSFSSIIKQKEFKSAFLIALGTLVKLYGIVGLAFFFFSKRKLVFIIAGLVSLAFLFLLPVSISSPHFIINSYAEWFTSLTDKNTLNATLTSMQDISLVGIIRRISGDSSIPNLPFLIAGVLIFALPYVRVKQYQYLGFRLMLLASVLIFAVIFSSSSESPTYIIAFAGVAIWFVIQPSPKNRWMTALFIFAIILTTLSPSDLFPKYIRVHYVWKYSLKALPCILIWFTIIYQMLTIDFKSLQLSEE
jgi:hypothetical protein